ncbi:MAG: DEAD/DEAH box helicase [Eubacteriales bacterium]|nr:DEAD/DEAH box helicase [Eubacteriales bacterium]
MKKDFQDLGILPQILQAIDEMGFKTPTEVQSRVIPHILNQEDMIVISKTGSGKTAVFGIPLLQMTDSDALEPQGLILTPTRELAVQIDNDLKQMSAYLPHNTIAVYGQHSMNTEIQALKKGASIVIGTPGRVFDHILHGTLKVKKIRFLVLDEADRMLDMGFIDQVFKIIKTIPKNRVTLLFSATIPTEIQHICQGYMKRPQTVEIESQTRTVDTIHQTYCRMNKNEKRTQLHRILMTERPESCLIFCNTRYAVDHVQSFLASRGYASQAIHGEIPQKKRLTIMQQFKQGDFHILVATDVAARGIHIEDLSLVINYDVPLEKDNYIHRIGRTGRAGKGGRAITMVTGDDIMSLYEIEEHTGAMIEEAELPSDTEIHACRADAEKWIIDKYKSSSLASAPVQKASEKNKRTRSRKPRRNNRQTRRIDGI